MNLVKLNVLGGSIGKRSLLALSLVMLASCRLIITTDETGHIVSASGASDCDQATCVIPINEFYTETFTAVAAEGFRFAGWAGLCEPYVTNLCKISLVPLTEEFSEFDGDLEMSAVFEPTTTVKAWYRDRDKDSYGAANRSKMAFEQPEGFVGNKLDCDDTNESVYPRAKELPDKLDNDCDGRIDEGFTETRFFVDRDGDGFGNPEISLLELEKPAGYVANKLDCNDSRAKDNPEAEEVADDRDNDCDGQVDEGGNRYYADVDRDGYGAEDNFVKSLEPLAGRVRDRRDCDDNNDEIHPGAREEFDSTDNDCDGVIDEGYTPKEYFRDVDSDGFGDDSSWLVDVVAPDGYVANSTDNCISIGNPSQADRDEDGIGDACDAFTDTDKDEVQDSADNCPESFNPNQRDVDEDGRGDVCDSEDDREEESGGGSNEGGCSMTAEERSMLDTVNAVRAQARVCGSYGSRPAVAPLAWSCELKAAALGHSMDMANNNFFSHTGTGGTSAGTRATNAGYSWSTWGENIAAGLSLSSVGAVVNSWVESPGHCANLMRSSFTELGAAKFSNSSSSYRVYWTQVFGKPR
jgi:uncharacterized protein YkwD